MKYKQVKDGYLLKFSKGEHLMQNLTAFIKEQTIPSAWLSGLGGALSAEIGFYNLNKQEYQWHTVAHLSEITNLTGNIAWDGETPVVHVHATFSDDGLRAVGGHVKEIVVGGTAEIHMRVFDEKCTRSLEEEVGLKTLDL